MTHEALRDVAKEAGDLRCALDTVGGWGVDRCYNNHQVNAPRLDGCALPKLANEDVDELQNMLELALSLWRSGAQKKWADRLAVLLYRTTEAPI